MSSMIIDISSDEDTPYTSTPVKTLVVNGIVTLDLSTSSTEANKGSFLTRPDRVNLRNNMFVQESLHEDNKPAY